MDFTATYGSQINQVLNESPVIKIGNALFDRYEGEMDTTDFFHLYSKLNDQWQKLKKHSINICIDLQKVVNYNVSFNIESVFNCFIKEALTNQTKHINLSCSLETGELKILSQSFHEEEQIKSDLTAKSYTEKSFLISFSKTGIDVYANGVLAIDNSTTTVYGSINEKLLAPIEKYKELLAGFYEDHIKNDRNERYLLTNTTCPAEWKTKVAANPYILINKPENKFQIDLSLYLRNNCSDIILNEVLNDDDDRYDIWVANSEQEIYVFEIKWLGKSITETGNFTTYNNKRAIEGAYQLNHYLKTSEEQSKANPKNRIRQGILVVFDAKNKDEEVVYPSELLKETNLDLSNILRLQPKKFSASSSHKYQ